MLNKSFNFYLITKKLFVHITQVFTNKIHIFNDKDSLRIRIVVFEIFYCFSCTFFNYYNLLHNGTGERGERDFIHFIVDTYLFVSSILSRLNYFIYLTVFPTLKV